MKEPLLYSDKPSKLKLGHLQRIALAQVLIVIIFSVVSAFLSYHNPFLVATNLVVSINSILILVAGSILYCSCCCCCNGGPARGRLIAYMVLGILACIASALATFCMTIAYDAVQKADNHIMETTYKGPQSLMDLDFISTREALENAEVALFFTAAFEFVNFILLLAGLVLTGTFICCQNHDSRSNMIVIA